MSAFPPHRSIQSIPVSSEIALKYLSSYLEASKTSPYLLPNARLEPSGPTAGSNNSSVVIHNLRRVEAGLGGEWIAPALDLGETNVPVADGMDDGTQKRQETAGGDGEGWVDLDEYQREQSIEGGDITEGGTGFVQEGDSDFDEPNEAHARGQEEEDRAHKVNEVKLKSTKKTKAKHENGPTQEVVRPKDKDARRKAKKERLKLEKRKRAEEKSKRKEE